MKLKISSENWKNKTEKFTCVATEATAGSSTVANNDNAFKLLQKIYLFYYRIFNFRLAIIRTIPKNEKKNYTAEVFAS